MAATPASHVAALRRLFATLEPDKHAQCETLWSRFGTDVWVIMRESFPGKDVEAFIPRSLDAHNFADVPASGQLEALTAFLRTQGPNATFQARQLWGRHGSGVWAYLAKQYFDCDINAYAPFEGVASPVKPPNVASVMSPSTRGREYKAPTLLGSSAVPVRPTPEVDVIQKLARRVGALVSAIVSGSSSERDVEEVQLAEAVSDLESRGQFVSDAIGPLLARTGSDLTQLALDSLLTSIKGSHADTVALELLVSLQPTSTRGWTCPKCHYSNTSSDSLACEVCTAPVPQQTPVVSPSPVFGCSGSPGRPVARRAVASSTQHIAKMLSKARRGSNHGMFKLLATKRRAQADWDCSVCTFRNPASLVSCDMCHTDRGVVSEGQLTISPVAAPAQCPICFDTYNYSDLITLPCLHQYCIDCMKGDLSVRINDAGPAKALVLPCPTPGCGKDVPPHVVQFCVDDDVYLKFSVATLRDLARSDGSFVVCPGGCGEIMATDPRYTLAVCTNDNCQFRFCVKCKNEAHGDLSCRDAAKNREMGPHALADALLKEQLVRDGYKKCPCCGDFVAKGDDGCDHLKCTWCGTDFCWGCAVLRSPIMSHGNHYHRRACPYFSSCCGKNCVLRRGMRCVKDVKSKQCSECKRSGALCAPPGDDVATDDKAEAVAAAGARDEAKVGEDGDDDVMFISPKFDPATLQAQSPGSRLASPYVFVREDGSKRGTSICLGDVPMESGVYRWRIVVAKDPGASTCVGVCTGDVSCPPGGFPFGKRANMWYFRSYRGGAYARGLELESTVQPFYSPGTVVELQYDANVGVLQISVNGEWQEAHITGITDTVYPLVMHYAGLQKVTQFVPYAQ